MLGGMLDGILSGMLSRSIISTFMMIFFMINLIQSGEGCTFCSTVNGVDRYCSVSCGSIINLVQYCNDGSQARTSPCCFVDHPAFGTQYRISQATCNSASSTQIFYYNASSKQFYITTSNNTKYCLEVYYSDFCNAAPTPILFYQCDTARINQRWYGTGSDILSYGGSDGTYCLASALGSSPSEAVARITSVANPADAWNFDFTNNNGVIQSYTSTKCLQMDSSLFNSGGTSSPTTKSPTLSPTNVGNPPTTKSPTSPPTTTTKSPTNAPTTTFSTLSNCPIASSCCICNCCTGPSCTIYLVGAFGINTCSCTQQMCLDQFPSNCPITGTISASLYCHTTTTGSPTTAPSNSNTFSSAAIAGIAVGSIFGVAFVVGLGVFGFIMYKKNA